MDLQTLVRQANEQIQRIKDWYEEHAKAFDYMDLKLHDVNYYCYSKMKEEFPLCYANDSNDENSYFYRFCDDQYTMFVEDLKENYGIDFEKNHRFHLGRTSSFYLHNQEMFMFNKHKIDWDWTMNGVMGEIYGSCCGSYLDFDNNGNVDLEKVLSVIEEHDYMDDEGVYRSLKEELNWLATEMFDEVVKHFENMLQVYDCLKNFKDNQVAIFKEWLQYYEDELAEEKRKAEEYAEQREKYCSYFDDEYIAKTMKESNISNEDIQYILVWHEQKNKNEEVLI